MKKRSTFRNIIIVTLTALLLLGGGLSFWLWRELGDSSSQPIILEADFDQPIVEDADDSPLTAFTRENRLTLQETLAALEAAAKDDRVKLLLARVGDAQPGLAQRQDIRDAVFAFRKRGKKAYAYSETFGEFSGGNGAYYLATAFDKIFLQPSGDLGLTGLIAEPMFVRGTLDKLDIVPRGGQRYEYKNALDFFTEKQMTPPYREAVNALLQSYQGQLIAGIAEGRKLPAEKVHELIDNGPYLGRQALAAGLVDRLLYRDQVYQQAREEVKGARLLNLQTYLDKHGSPYAKGKPIALIYGVGAVARGESQHNPFIGEDVMGSDTVCAGFRAAIEDDDIKVIIFRIDSPGGSYVASDAVLREMERAREKGKKVIVSMGNVAGSGGYIVALAADRVIAQPGTITGSIGVLALKLLTRNFWSKFGITYDSEQIARNANMWSTLSDYSPEQWAKFNAWLDRIYDEFTDKVAKGRKLSKARVLEIAKGRIWSGEEAQKLGLVDELGGFSRAVAVARDLEQIPAGEKVNLMRYPRPKSLFEMLRGKQPENSEQALMRAMVKTIAPVQPLLKAAGQLQASPAERVVAMPDFDLE